MGRFGNVFIHAGAWLGLGLLFYGFFLRQESPPIQVVGPDRVELTRARDGHFHIDGTIQGKPVRFLIDTGASTVSISMQFAERIGLGCDVASTFRTANGLVEGCTGRIAALDFGPFRIENLSVAILPDLGGAPLLGMNALRQVRMEQVADKLSLSRLE
jgi:clan AA aspartic protease (TIGR02281 family)